MDAKFKALSTSIAAYLSYSVQILSQLLCDSKTVAYTRSANDEEKIAETIRQKDHCSPAKEKEPGTADVVVSGEGDKRKDACA